MSPYGPGLWRDQSPGNRNPRCRHAAAISLRLDVRLDRPRNHLLSLPSGSRHVLLFFFLIGDCIWGLRFPWSLLQAGTGKNTAASSPPPPRCGSISSAPPPSDWFHTSVTRCGGEVWKDCPCNPGKREGAVFPGRERSGAAADFGICPRTAFTTVQRISKGLRAGPDGSPRAAPATVPDPAARAQGWSEGITWGPWRG